MRLHKPSPDPICAQIKQAHFLDHVAIEIGTAACKSCTALCYMDLQDATGTQGGAGPKRKAEDSGDEQAGPSKASKRRAAAKAKAMAVKAQLTHLKALTSDDRGPQGPGGKLSKQQKKKLAEANKVLALTNGRGRRLARFKFGCA